jgi:hypothetical protein
MSDKPKNAGELSMMSVNGAMIIAMTVIQSLCERMEKHPLVYVGPKKMLINQILGTVRKLNDQMADKWSLEQGDHVLAAADDLEAIMRVIAITDRHSRMDIADSFRHLYADFRTEVGDGDAQTLVEADIMAKRVERGLPFMKADDFYTLPEQERQAIVAHDKELWESSLAQVKANNNPAAAEPAE